jgi:hypothetical protein
MSDCKGCGQKIQFFDLDCPRCGLNTKPVKLDPSDITSDYKVEMYHVQKTYLEGWFTITDLQRIIETAERVNRVNSKMAEESKPEGFKTMDETAAPIVEVGWQTNRKSPQ